MTSGSAPSEVNGHSESLRRTSNSLYGSSLALTNVPRKSACDPMYMKRISCDIILIRDDALQWVASRTWNMEDQTALSDYGNLTIWGVSSRVHTTL